MDFLVLESRRSLAKSLPRFFEAESRTLQCVIEDEGDKSFQGLKAIRAYGLLGVETLSLRWALAPGSRGRRFTAVLAHQLLEFARSDNAISID